MSLDERMEDCLEDQIENLDTEASEDVFEEPEPDPDESELPESPILDPVPSDDAEPVSAEEALSTVIPIPEPIAAEEAHIASLVCDVCLELNLTQKSCIACIRCGQAFCYHFASAIDVQYCVNCMSDMSVTKQVVTKTYEHRNQQSGEINYYRRRAREVKIEGLDWLFAQRKIVDLSDVELDMAIEYHRNICSLMIAESERRRTEYMHRNARVKIVLTPSTTKVTDSKTTTVKKTRTVSKNKQTEQLAALLASMKAKGVDINTIATMLKGVK